MRSGTGLILILGFVAMAGSRSALAQDELRELYRGARATAMGGAFTGLADDEEAIFYNPAGMAGINKFGINYAVMDAEVSGDLVATGLSGGSAFANLSGSSLNQLMGKDIYAHGQFSPSFVMPNFGFAVLLDQQASLVSENMAMPQETLGYQFTNGIQAAYGVSLNKVKGAKSEVRLGIAGKLLWRRGGYRTLGPLELMTVNANTLSSIAGSFGRGIGADVGAQWVYRPSSRMTASVGTAFTDIGNTAFDGGGDPVVSNLSAGAAVSYTLPRMKATLAYDYRHILDTTEFRKRSHLGAELAIPFISIYGGLYQMALTYGASFDLWIFKITAVSYAEELDAYVFQNTERRWLLHIALKFGL